MHVATRTPAVTRLIVAMTIGLAAALLMPWSWPAVVRVLVGWLAFAVAIAAWLLPLVTLDAARTREAATKEDDTRTIAALVVVVAALAALVSLVGVGFALHEAARHSGDAKLAIAGLGVAAVAASWTLVHLEYMLHYAHRFHRDGGGVDFPRASDIAEPPGPTYLDFAYLAFTLGMTYQVSDTDITTRAMRRLVLRHVLLSYLFGVAIIGVTINAVASVVSAG